MDGYQATCECGWAGPVRPWDFEGLEMALSDVTGHPCRKEVLLMWDIPGPRREVVPTATVTVLRKVEAA